MWERAGPVAAKAVVTHATGTGTPTGSVNFYVDGGTTVAGSGTLSSGSYTFNYNPSKLTAGNHTIAAVYEGDSDFAASTSPGATLGVQDFRVTRESRYRYHNRPRAERDVGADHHAPGRL